MVMWPTLGSSTAIEQNRIERRLMLQLYSVVWCIPELHPRRYSRVGSNQQNLEAVGPAH